jgi:hypothetical protein
MYFDGVFLIPLAILLTMAVRSTRPVANTSAGMATV